MLRSQKVGCVLLACIVLLEIFISTACRKTENKDSATAQAESSILVEYPIFFIDYFVEYFNMGLYWEYEEIPDTLDTYEKFAQHGLKDAYKLPDPILVAKRGLGTKHSHPIPWILNSCSCPVVSVPSYSSWAHEE